MKKTKAAARPRKVAKSPVAKSRRASSGFSLPTPPPPEEVVAAVREKLQKLGQRWKSILPRLKDSKS